MKLKEILLGGMILASPLKAQTSPPLIQDGDMKHVAASGAAFITAEQISYYFTKDEKKSQNYAAIFSLGLGFGKEFIYDGLLKRGHNDQRDYFFNGLGLLAGWGFNKVANKFFRKKLPLQISFSYILNNEIYKN